MSLEASLTQDRRPTEKRELAPEDKLGSRRKRRNGRQGNPPPSLYTVSLSLTSDCGLDFSFLYTPFQFQLQMFTVLDA